MNTTIPLGQLLKDDYQLSPDDIDSAMKEQKKSGGRLGEILASLGKLSPLQLHKALAEQSHRPFVNLLKHPCEASLLSADQLSDYIRFNALPWRKVDGHMVIACTHVTDDLSTWASKHFGEKTEYVITSPRDIGWMTEQHFASHIDTNIRELLATQSPEFSARQTLSPKQKRDLILFAAMLATCAIWYPYTSFLVFLVAVNLFYCLTMLFKFFLLSATDGREVSSDDPDYWREMVPDDSLPIYTILVPLHEEEESIPRILSAIRALDYPKHKLDVKLVVEADDEGTIQAIKRAEPEAYFEIIRVPYSQPQTKPKACNYALTFARGEFTTIYDAEDRPDPMQLRKAVHIFRHTPKQVACLQARLNYYNQNENLLSRCFSIEYATLFDLMLPGLQRLGIPIPLGGTSNHVYTDVLREIGEWDPYNVTEDADLGMRLSMHGYHTRMMPSMTLEESPLTFFAWLKQRSRWIKGYMQTWLVHMRRPNELSKHSGRLGFWGFQLFIGGPCFIFLLSPILWIICLLWLFGLTPPGFLPGWLIYAQFAILGIGLISHLWFAMIVNRLWQWDDMKPTMIAYPFYWLLHSAASFRALWQLIRRPHFWEKTTHGLTRFGLRDIAHSIRNVPC